MVSERLHVLGLWYRHLHATTHHSNSTWLSMSCLSVTCRVLRYRIVIRSLRVLHRNDSFSSPAISRIRLM